MREDLHKHLEFVQAVFALAAKDSKPAFLLVALFPALSFWGLDAYYFLQERLFRALYDDLRLASEDAPRKVEPFSLSTSEYRKHVQSWFPSLWSPTVVAVHGAVVGTILIVLAAVQCGWLN